MKLINYIVMIFVIAITAALLNLIEGVYFGLAVPVLSSVKIGGTQVKMPSNPLPFANNVTDILLLLIGLLIFAILIYIVNILKERSPYS